MTSHKPTLMDRMLDSPRFSRFMDQFTSAYFVACLVGVALFALLNIVLVIVHGAPLLISYFTETP